MADNNMLALQIKQFDAATPLANAEKVRSMQVENAQNLYKQQQLELGSTARGLQQFVGTPEFATKWAEAADNLRSKGVLNDQTLAQWRNNPSPLMLKAIISQTESPELAFRREQAKVDQANSDRSFAQQKLASDRSFSLQKSNADRTYELQKRAADRVDEDKPVLKEVTDAAGNTTLVRVNPKGPEGPVDTGVKAPPVANPFSAGGKFNEGEGKAAGFADRMLQAEGILTGTGSAPGVEGAGINPWQASVAGLENVPVLGGVFGAGANAFLKSTDRQKYEQAKRDFINAQLRRESGAAISPSEFDSAEKQYFPQVGQGPEIIQQKANARRAAIEAMGREGGKSYRPRAVFAPDGKLAYRPATEADFNRLQKGDRFIDPEGNVRVKQ